MPKTGFVYQKFTIAVGYLVSEAPIQQRLHSAFDGVLSHLHTQPGVFSNFALEQRFLNVQKTVTAKGSYATSISALDDETAALLAGEIFSIFREVAVLNVEAKQMRQQLSQSA